MISERPGETRAFLHARCRLVPDGEYFVPAGLFPNHELERDSQTSIDEKPLFHTLTNDTPMLTGKQVFEQFAADDHWAADGIAVTALASLRRLRRNRFT